MSNLKGETHTYYTHNNIRIELNEETYTFIIYHNNKYIMTYADYASIEEMLKKSYESYRIQTKLARVTALEFKQAYDEVVAIEPN